MLFQLDGGQVASAPVHLPGSGFDGVADCHARAGLVSPSICLITWSGLLAAYASLKVHLGGEPSPDVTKVWTFGLQLLVVYWVRVDSRRTKYRPSFEYEAFMFFAWPIALPQYLVHTRGLRRGLLVLAAFVAVWFVPAICVAILRGGG